MKKLFFFFIIITGIAKAQDSTAGNPLTISGYVEAYYIYDFNKPVRNTRAGFVYSHNRANEITLNLGLIKAAYLTDQIRANLALASGTYMNANLAAEPGVFKNIFEANVGFRLSKTSHLWLDAGILPSHIGFESAIGKDCWNLTRTILADNSPYFEAGARLSYTSANQQWYLAAMILNGWQRIQRVDGNSTPAFGTQITYKPSTSVLLNSSSFIGNDKPDSVRLMRYFHNFYGIFQLNSKLAATIGLDVGLEQIAKGSSKMNTWFSPVAILKITTSLKTSLAMRATYYQDRNGVIIATGTHNGFQTWGFSSNFDVAIGDRVLWRIETGTFHSKDNIFNKNNNTSVRNNTMIATAITVGF